MRNTSIRGAVDNRVIAFGLLAAVFVGILGYWRITASSKEGEFVEALVSGGIAGMPIDLRDKEWSDAELSDIEMLRLDNSFGKERALLRAANRAGSYTVSSQLYSFQATITDSATGKRHIFGRIRREPQHWVHAAIDPATIQIRQNPYYKPTGAPSSAQ